jgi:hypothetical protein
MTFIKNKPDFAKLLFEVIDYMDKSFVKEKKCATDCPLWHLIRTYMEDAQEKGSVDMILRLKKENKELRSEIHQIKGNGKE